MAVDSDMRSWADLLHNSSQLLHSSTPSAQFPPIQRSLDQLETLSRQLKARTSRFEAPNETIAATRLLAREGINADQLTRDLKSFELKTTFEDVFPVEATSVEEYLQQVHEMSMISAIQEAHKDNVRNFDDYMLKIMEDDWQKEKRDFLSNLSRLPFSTSGSVEAVSSSSIQGVRGTPGGVRATPETRVLEYSSSSHRSILDRKAAAYADVVVQLNAARERSVPFKIATSLRDAYGRVAGENSSPRSVNMAKIWHLLQSLLGEDVDRNASASRKMIMIAGARRHLEVGHEKYILDTIHSHAAQAALGGSTGNIQRIRAFLRVRLRDHGPLDFDTADVRRQPPMDTTWHQVYFCLRSGYYEEAQHVAFSSRVSRTFAPQLAEWIATGGCVSPGTAAAVAEECERMARTGDRPGRPGYDKKKMLLHAIVSGSRQQGDRLLRDIPVLFSTIEDFLWFKLAMVRDTASDASIAGVVQQGLTPYTLEDLQRYLIKFEPSYYTKNGKDPLVYPYILLLSLQFHTAIAYIMKEGNTEGYPIDAVHMAIALADFGFWADGSGDAQKLGSMDSVSEIASIIRQYGLTYVRQGSLDLALEYYVQAAAAIGGGAISWSLLNSSGQQRQRQLMMKQLLTELLLRDGGVALLLGPTGVIGDGMLKRFMPDSQAQQHLLFDAARQCQESGLYDKAVELLRYVGAYAMALEILNQRLSDAISAMVSGRSDGDTKIAGLVLNGNELLDAQKAGGPSSQDVEQILEQQASFRQLESVLAFHKYARSSRYGDALRELSKLSFLPLDTRTPERSVEALRTTSPSVQACIPDLLKVAITCLDNVTDTDGTVRLLKTKIANFVANSLPRNLPQDLYERVARML
ncbi:nuclear pore complex protein Nup93 [Marchantia polymorpha subsp. ruderalis]|nr:hypothetical protein MARPO_0069s0022 [Marchantia polymorpha]BBN03469.1 hypothetical protein Mp_2g23730 [Marchantia polymorpha subsp. ruderalis]|eukprot:PTQ35676.1 hypothetical protein MARPO_0069s0022 [Marchantia polymorpha]